MGSQTLLLPALNLWAVVLRGGKIGCLGQKSQLPGLQELTLAVTVQSVLPCLCICSGASYMTESRSGLGRKNGDGV